MKDKKSDPPRTFDPAKVDKELFRQAMDELSLQIHEGLRELMLVVSEAVGPAELRAALTKRISISGLARSEATERLLRDAFAAVSQRA